MTNIYVLKQYVWGKKEEDHERKQRRSDRFMHSFIQTRVYQVSTIFKAVSWNKNPEMVKSFAVQIQSTFVEYFLVLDIMI